MQEFDDLSENRNPYAAPLASSSESVDRLPEDYTGQEFRPFKSIWSRPRKTIRRIISTDPTLHVTMLACLAGIGEALDRASMRGLGDKLSLAVVLGTAVILGPLGGLISLWIGSHLIRISGTWIGGLAPRQHLKAAIAWAAVPSIAGLPLWVGLLGLLGSETFTSETPLFDIMVEQQPLYWIPFLGIAVLEVTLAVWGLILLCNTIAEVQGFRSAWAGFGNMILAGLILLVPILLVVGAVIFVKFT